VLQINWRDFLDGRFDLFDTAPINFTATAPLTFDPFEWGPDGRGQGNVGGQLVTPQNRNLAAILAVCPTVPAYGNRSDLAATIRTLLTGALVAYPHAGCITPGTLRGDKTMFGAALTASPIFFYVTADVVNACNLSFPNADTYWTTYAMNKNVITGDVIYLNAAQNFSESFPAVHIEAALSQTRAVLANPFYGEKVLAATNTYREPLATALAFRYGNDPLLGISSNVILWKNFSELTASGTKIDDCGSYIYYAWDMDERSLSRTTQPISGLPTGGLDPNQFPFETQKVPLSTLYFDLPGAYGWMLIVLPPSYINAAGWVDPTTGTTVTTQGAYMGWAATQIVYGLYSTGTEAWTMANYWCNSTAFQVMPQLGANAGTAAVAPYGFIQP